MTRYGYKVSQNTRKGVEVQKGGKGWQVCRWERQAGQEQGRRWVESEYVTFEDAVNAAWPVKRSK